MADDEWDTYDSWLESNVGEAGQQTYLKTFTVLYSLIFCISVCGNTFLLWVLVRFEDLKRMSNLLLLHHTVTDLMITVILPFWAAEYDNNNWVMGDAMCKLAYGVRSLGLYGYMIFLTAMTVHRYRAVIRPRSASLSGPPMHALCFALWLLCFLFSIPKLIYAKAKAMETSNGTVYCRQVHESPTVEYLINHMQITIFFLLPFAIIAFCYTRMWLRIRQCRMAKKFLAMRRIFLIVVGFFICWAPYNTFNFILFLSLHRRIPRLNYTAAYRFARVASYTLIYLHGGFSPFVHVFGAEKFRKRLPLPFIKTPGSESASPTPTDT